MRDGLTRCCKDFLHTGGGVFRPMQKHGCSGLNRHPGVPAAQTPLEPTTLMGQGSSVVSLHAHTLNGTGLTYICSAALLKLKLSSKVGHKVTQTKLNIAKPTQRTNSMRLAP